MKILLVGNGRLESNYGGGQVYVRNLIAGLLDDRHTVEYLSRSFSDVSVPQTIKQVTFGVPEIQLVLPLSWIKLGVGGNKLFVDMLASTFRGASPEIIHAHGWEDIAALAARQVGVPCFVTAHHGGIVCPAGALLNADDQICRVPASDDHCLKCCVKSVPGWRLWYPLLRNIPLRFRLWLGDWLRRFPFVLFMTPLGTVACNIRDKLQAVRDIGAAAYQVIAPSPAIAEALVRNGIPEQKVVVIPHGIPLPQRQPLRRDLGNGPVRFVFVGRINPVKGVHIMLEAFAGLSADSYELHIVGEAVTRQEQRYLSRLQRNFVTVNAVWHGSVPHEAIRGHIVNCDVMVHPAICLEVFGLTIAEALAVGRPVIATRCGGGETQIRDGENGLLVPSNDVEALRKAILKVANGPRNLKSIEPCTLVKSVEKNVEDLIVLYGESIR